MSDESMRASTRNAPVFYESACEILRRLHEDRSLAAVALKNEAQMLATFFASWDEQPPSSPERVEAIKRLFDLRNRSMDYQTAIAKVP